MKILILSLPVFAALFLSGCGQKDAAPSGAAAAPAPAPAAPAAPAAASARVIEITGNDQMKFSVTTIEAKVGEELKIVFNNIGSLPKEAMGHNWVLLKPGSDAAAFAAAAIAAKDKDYIPDALKGQIVAHTKMLGPKQSDTVTFKVTAAGEYPFLCSFPAHYMVGMRGMLSVK